LTPHFEKIDILYTVTFAPAIVPAKF